MTERIGKLIYRLELPKKHENSRCQFYNTFRIGDRPNTNLHHRYRIPTVVVVVNNDEK